MERGRVGEPSESVLYSDWFKTKDRIKQCSDLFLEEECEKDLQLSPTYPDHARPFFFDFPPPQSPSSPEQTSCVPFFTRNAKKIERGLHPG